MKEMNGKIRVKKPQMINDTKGVILIMGRVEVVTKAEKPL